MDEPPITPPPPPPEPGQGPDWGEMKNKIGAAKGPDRIALVAGAVFFVASFLSWFTVRVGPASIGVNAWDVGGIAMIASVLALIATVFALLRVLGVKFTVPMSDGRLLFTLGIIVFALTVLRLLVKPGTGGLSLLGGTVRISRGLGLYLATISGAALAYAGWVKLRSEK
jgi:hypothetical protein